MENVNIKNSITLLGPPCVGKSLISSKLSEKTGLPIISLDSLRFFVASTSFDILENNPDDFNAFKESIKRHFEVSYTNTESQLLNSKKEDEVIRELYDEYFAYKKLLGNLDRFVEIYTFVYENEDLPPYINRLYDIALDQAFYNLCLGEIFERINSPVIFDMPGFFGWKIPNPNDSYRYIDVESIYNNSLKFMPKIGTKVLLEPGKDYHLRTDSKGPNSKTVLENMDLYYDNADIIISTNGEFFEPENLVAFEDRELLNIRAIIEREKLINHSEISSICEQILQMKQDLLLLKNQPQ